MGYSKERNAAYSAYSTSELEVAQCSDRHTLHSGIDEISKRLIRIASRVENVVSRVEGSDKVHGEVAKVPIGNSLRDRLNAFFPILNEIEAALGDLESGVGSESSASGDDVGQSYDLKGKRLL